MTCTFAEFINYRPEWGITMACDKCGSKTHRDDAMNARCNNCEYKIRQCICEPMKENEMLVIFVDADGWKTFYAQGNGVVYRWYSNDPREWWDIVPWIGY